MKVNNIKTQITKHEYNVVKVEAGAREKLEWINEALGNDDYTGFIVGLRDYLVANPDRDCIRLLDMRLRKQNEAVVNASGIHTGANANVVALWQIFMEVLEENGRRNRLDLLKGTVESLCEVCYENVLAGGILPVSNINLVIDSADMIEEGLSGILQSQINTISISECPATTHTSCMYLDSALKLSILMLRQDADDDYRLIMFVREICKVLYYLYCHDKIDDISCGMLNEMDLDYHDENEAYGLIITAMALGYIRKANWDIDTQDFMSVVFTKKQWTIAENFITFIGKRVVEKITLKNVSFIHHPAFADVRDNPDMFYNGTDIFEYVNYNPKGLTGVGDHAFQVLKHFRGDLSDREIVKCLIKEQVAHGINIFDGPALDRIIRDNLDFKSFAFGNTYLINIVQEMEFPPETEDVIIRCGSHLYVYDPVSHKFYGSHPIPKYSKVSKIWIRRDAV